MLELRKQLLRVAMVYLLQHGVWQTQTVNHPAPLQGILSVRKIFIFRLEPAEIVLVHRLRGAFIGAEHDAIGILHEDFARPLGLTSQFALASAGLNHDVGKFLQRLLDEIKVFRPAAKMKRYESSIRMFRKHAVALR